MEAHLGESSKKQQPVGAQNDTNKSLNCKFRSRGTDTKLFPYDERKKYQFGYLE